MKFEMHTRIVTHDLEVRVDTEHNFFQFTEDGYHVYPLEEALTLYKSEKEKVGKAIPKRIVWEDGTTTLVYELISLHSVN